MAQSQTSIISSTFFPFELIDIKFAEATENILALRNALSPTVDIGQPALANTSAELGDNIGGMNGNNQPIIISNDQSSQIVNNSSSKAAIAIAKNTNPPDVTINAIKPKGRLGLYGN